MPKKLLFYLLIVALSFNYVISQEDILRPKGRKIIGNQTVEKEKYKRRPFILGIEGGLNYNMFGQDMAWGTALPNTPFEVLKMGQGFSPYFGANLGIELSDKIALHLRLNYDQKFFSNEKTGDIDVYIQQTNQIVTGQEKQDYDNKLAYIHLAFDLRYNFNKNLFGTFGVFYQSQIGDLVGNFNQTLLTKDAFYGNGTATNHISGTSTGMPDRTGIEIGVGYKIPISKNAYLVPTGRFQWALTKTNNDESTTDIARSYTVGIVPVNLTNRKLNSIQLGLALWFEL
jgi:hypothetical protein